MTPVDITLTSFLRFDTGVTWYVSRESPALLGRLDADEGSRKEVLHHELALQSA